MICRSYGNCMFRHWGTTSLLFKVWFHFIFLYAVYESLIPLVSRYLKKDLLYVWREEEVFIAKFEGQDHEPLPLSSKFYSFWLILRFQSSFPHFVLFSVCHIITEDTSLLWMNVLWNQLSWTHGLYRDCQSYYVDQHPSYIVLYTFDGLFICKFWNWEMRIPTLLFFQWF